jgi:DNA-binding MarR family transcriptional regulator
VSGSDAASVMEASTLDALRVATVELFGAERRLRGRDQQTRGLTHAQLRALFELESSDAVTAGQLARSANLNPASVTAMLDNLEQAGIVERHRDSPDRRVCMVSLTDAGHAIVAERRERWQTLWEQCLGHLSQTELEAGLQVIRSISGLLDSL